MKLRKIFIILYFLCLSKFAHSVVTSKYNELPKETEKKQLLDKGSTKLTISENIQLKSERSNNKFTIYFEISERVVMLALVAGCILLYLKN